ncbi:HTH domain-containing protein, partial [Cetobacterium sp.]|uniref:HTH domain-containing protein n=1 Tax=Cetobacterium sp. TaxID=2071632 RepID=UPI003F2F946A
MLNQRCMDIIQKFIDSNGENNIKNLEKSFGISERTVRNDIEKIDRYLLDNIFSGISKRYGGSLKIQNIEKVKEFFLNKNSYDLSSQERVEYIIISCLISNTLNIAHLSEELEISRTTITNDLKEVKRILDEFNIELKSDHKNGFLILALEENIRKLMLKILMKKNKTNLNIKMKNIISQMTVKNTKGIDMFMSYIQNKLNIVMSDEAFQVINLYIEIMIKRIQKQNKLNKILNENFLKSTKEYEKVNEFLPILNSYYE